MHGQASKSIHLEREKGPMSIAPRFGPESRTKRTIQAISIPNGGWGRVRVSSFLPSMTDGNTITIATSGWSIE
jgi:hypothetical protein